MRKRIVIDLDAPQGGPAARGASVNSRPGGKRAKWRRILALFMGVVLVVVLAAIVGGFFGWRYYQSTPAYTLTLMIDAAQRNDLAEFEKRIDDEEIAKNMLATVSQKAAGRYGFALSSSIQQRIDTVMPTLLPGLQQTIHEEVVKEIKEFASKSEPRPFIFLVVTVPSLMKVTTEGDIAKATAVLSQRTIELTMRRDAERWKVIEFKDDVVVQRVVDSVMKELPPIGTIDPNSPLLKKSARGKRRR
ncbi:MAG TPA: hypothetical protein VM656_02055 [Pyrinomonadaceae bacterium]|nr:hypothetical protein [Pyrinomonadaceae bacterium]